jgi:hypothetical protein
VAAVRTKPTQGDTRAVELPSTPIRKARSLRQDKDHPLTARGFGSDTTAEAIRASARIARKPGDRNSRSRR